ncbi:hypothetical protein BDF22DRAFT_681535 [Syncephalis plumigaleata]|nr:hypothetical protein BDF22DRAFT_681535 [Syncephalis plumigaleata]
MDRSSTRSLPMNDTSIGCQRDTRQNPQPPCNYTLSEQTAIITGESLIQALRVAIDNETDASAPTSSNDSDDTILEQRLASIWDAASLESYAYEFIDADVHHMLLDIITPQNTRNTNDEDNGSKEDSAEASTSNDQTSSDLQFQYRSRTVELALGALANLPVACLLIANLHVCTISTQILAQTIRHSIADDKQQQRLHENSNSSLLKLYQFALSGWSMATRLVNMLHYTQHMPLRIAALDTLRCWLRDMDTHMDITKRLKQQMQYLVNALPE